MVFVKTPPPPLTDSRHQFAFGVAQATGLDPGVIYAWTQAENTDTSVARRPGNYLNLELPGTRSESYSGVPVANIDYASDGGRIPGFNTLQDGIQETAFWINNFPNFKAVKQSAALPPDGQIAAIVGAPWAAGHYGTNGQDYTQSRVYQIYHQNQSSSGTMLTGFGINGITPIFGPDTGLGKQGANTVNAIPDLITKAGKDIMYAVIIVMGGMLIITGLILIGADLGLEGLREPARKVYQPIGVVGRARQSQRYGNPSSSRRVKGSTAGYEKVEVGSSQSDDIPF